MPIEGSIDEPRGGIIPTLASVLRNAFIQALTPRVEGSIDIESAKPEKGSKPPPMRDTKKNEKSDQERVRAREEEKK